MKYKLLAIFTVLITSILLIGIKLVSDNTETYSISSKDIIKMAVITDIHYLSESLRDNGSEFNEFINDGDGKLIQYGSEIMESLILDLKEQAIDILVASGDLTTNGEKASHEDLANYFSIIEENGTQVYVVPGNHDINNPYALEFKGDRRYYAKRVSPSQFKEIYSEFGYDNKTLNDPNSLSYIAKPAEDLWLLMLDSNKYDDNIKIKSPVMDGEINKDTIKWINTLDIDEDISVLSVMHHNLMQHSPMFYNNYVLNNSEETIDTLKNIGVTLNLSGHIHIQDIAVEEDMYDIVTGSLSVYPQKYGLINIKENMLTYDTKWIDMEKYAKKNDIEDDNLINFRKFSEESFSNRSYIMARERLSETYDEDDINEMAKLMSTLNNMYFAGNNSLNKEELKLSKGYKLWESAEESFIKRYIMILMQDITEDNYLELKL